MSSYHIIPRPDGRFSIYRFPASRASAILDSLAIALKRVRELTSGAIYIHKLNGTVKRKIQKVAVVQIRNPRSGLYVKINRRVGTIIAHKKTDGPYKGIPTVESAAL